MKNLIYLFGLLTALVVSSCSEDETFYSCDEQEDALVKENLDEIQKMTRSEWLKTSQDLKIPMYRAFTLEQKQKFWLERTEKIMGDYDWTEDEKKHLMCLCDAIIKYKSWFKSRNQMDEQELEAIEVFEYKWTEYAANELLWSEKLIGAMVYTGEEVSIVNGVPTVTSITVASKKRTRSASESRHGDCNCRESGEPLNCYPFSCLTGYNVCDRTDGGCGFFGGVDCNGWCPMA